MAEERLVLSDTSPLIGLAAAGQFTLLRELFGAVAITATVRREVVAGKQRAGAKEAAVAIRAGWLRVLRDRRKGTDFPTLDAGEASILRHALAAGQPCLILMDEMAGRQEAQALGLKVVGTAGLLLVARQRGLIPALRPVFEALMSAEFRISAEVIAAVLKQAGEG